MRSLIWGSVVVLLAAGAPAGSVDAAGKIRVVATITDLKALTDAVGGDLVEVDALARPSQNPHDLEVRPSLMLKVRRADLLLINGLELDQWAEVVVQGANNPKVIPGGPGRVDVSQGIPVLDVPTTRVDRSMGDVHPIGNPHYTVDPGMAPIMTATILEALARVAPQSRPVFERNRNEFLARLDQAAAGWTRMIEPFRGAKVVEYHPLFAYLFARFGLTRAGAVEDRPGIPPTPDHLVRLISDMRQQQIKLLVVEPWNDIKLAERVAREAGAKVRVLAPNVGAVKEADSYLTMVDYNVRAIADGLR